ncbi:dienelactone hydrolase family protein [Parapedobacter sp.]
MVKQLVQLVFLMLPCIGLNAQELSEEAAGVLADSLIAAEKLRYREQAEQQWAQKQIVHPSGAVMKFKFKVFGEKPMGGRSLYISLHGGGNATAEVNDKQWANQIDLYAPKEGVYVAPRAPTNTWMLWHEDFIDDLFDELIKTAVIMEEVDPNKVYLMGYSAGGDGVFQLATRMADRWAAAAMMAGHPNDARPENLRNLPFAVFMGGLDSAYRRNRMAKEWTHTLDSLERVDQGGYMHISHIYPQYGHWMERADTVALDWMASYTRQSNPHKVVWVQDDRPHERFYWLGVPPAEAEHGKGKKIVATIAGQTVSILENDYKAFYIYLNDELIDLDQPITVRYKGTQVMQGRFYRDRLVVAETVNRLDKRQVATVRLNMSSGD